MSEIELADRVYGSKVTFVIEESMVMVQFLCKLCMCLLYLKLTLVHTNRWQVGVQKTNIQRAVRAFNLSGFGCTS